MNKMEEWSLTKTIQDSYVAQGVGGERPFGISNALLGLGTNKQASAGFHVFWILDRRVGLGMKVTKKGYDGPRSPEFPDG